MPRVPSYGGRRVSRGPLPSARLTAVPTPDVFGAELGQTLTRIGRQLYAEERRKHDQLAVLTADNELAAWEQQRLFHPETGAFAVKGQDALGLAATVGEEFTQRANAIEARLQGERQRVAFREQAARRRLNLTGRLERHTFEQLQQIDLQETENFLKNATADAITDARDPRRVSEELARGTAALRDYARRNGVGAETTQRMVADFRTRIHDGVIRRLLTLGQDSSARVYFEETKDQISGEALERIEQALEEGTLRGQAQQQTDAILGRARTLTEARESAKAIDEPKLRDEVLRRVEHEWAIKDRLDREREEASLVEAFNLVERGGLRAIPPDLWSTLPGPARHSLRAYVKALVNTGKVETDLPTYYGLMQRAMDNPAAFARENLLTFRHKLDETEFKQLAGLQLSIRNNERNKTEELLDDFRTPNQVIEQSLDIFGVDAKAPENKAAVSRLWRMVADRVNTLQRATGKKATREDIQAITDDLLSQPVTVSGSWWNIWPLGARWGPNAPFFETQKRLIDLTIDDVPAADRRQIEEALRTHGRSVTDEAILQLYLDTQMRLRR